jgi:hypothetical protein
MAFILPGHRRLHEPGLVGGDDQLRTVAGGQLGQQPAHVGLHRGATTRQVLAALATESAVVVVVIGTVLGAASAALALWGAVSGLRAQTGVPVALQLPWPMLAAASGACLVPALLAGLVPARRARFAPAAAGQTRHHE